MNFQQTLAHLRRGAVMTVAVLAAAACQDDREMSLIEPDDLASGDVSLSLAVSEFGARAGDEITVAIDVDGPVAVGGVEGYLHFDPSALRFSGQVPEAATPVIVNDRLAERGELRLVSVNLDGYAETSVALLSFEVLRAGYEGAVRFEPSLVSSMDQRALTFDVDSEVGRAASFSGEGRFMTVEDWAEFLEPGSTQIIGPARAPGDSDLYGDANNDGTIGVFDVLTTAQLNASIIECVTQANDCLAANVTPINDGVGGACEPGLDVCGGVARSINVFDVLAVAQDNAGNPDHPVAGEPIPRAPAVGAGDTVYIARWLVDGVGATPGGGGPAITVDSTITFTNDKLWVLERQLRIGNPTGAAGVLNVEPGTLVEGLDSTSILITVNGQIFADGTPTQPITFSCFDDGSTPGSSLGFRAPGCWGGVYIAGNATLNEGNAAPSVAISGRTGAGALRRAAEGFDPADVFFGGDNDADNSGVLRYVRFLWGGFEVTTANELNNLTLGGVGSGTVLENIQVHGGSDDGIEFFGGRVDLKYLYATENDDDSDDYSFGYDGDQQFILIQTALSTRFLGDSDAAFEVDNTEDAATYKAAGPGGVPGRTFSNVWNLTLVAGDSETSVRDKAFNYRRGAGSYLGNVVVANAAEVFDVDETASCDALPGQVDYNPPAFQLWWTHTLVLTGNAAGTQLGISNACEPLLDGIIADSLTDASIIATTSPGAGSLEYRNYAGEFRNAWDRDLPDFRPAVGGFGFSGTTPPAGFDNATYVGAVNPSGIPWYSGWTLGSAGAR